MLYLYCVFVALAPRNEGETAEMPSFHFKNLNNRSNQSLAFSVEKRAFSKHFPSRNLHVPYSITNVSPAVALCKYTQMAHVPGWDL